MRSTVELKFDPSKKGAFEERPFRLTIGTAVKRLYLAEVESLLQDCRVSLREQDDSPAAAAMADPAILDAMLPPIDKIAGNMITAPLSADDPNVVPVDA
jgi:hypothetical protein